MDSGTYTAAVARQWRGRGTLVVLALLVLLFAAACGGGAAGDGPGTGEPDPLADAGPACEPGRAGTLGCECLIGDNTGNGSCTGDLRCVGGLCEACPRGEDGCACLSDDVCSGDLVCTDALCLPPSCEDGALDCPCRGQGEPVRCDGAAYCAESGICAVCTSDVAGCPCAGGQCENELVCGEQDLCRAAVVCEDLRGAGECGLHQVCEETPGEDARCIAESCEEGYQWDPALAGCVPFASCTAGDPGSIASECFLQNRECVVQEGGDDFCGDCLLGSVLDEGECVSELYCGDGVVCGPDEYCDRDVGGGGGGPICLPRPCTAPDQVVGTDGSCQVCTRSCDVEGSTGRYWPFVDSEGKCVCETRPGYFFPRGGKNNPLQCDADGDGWTRDEVRQSWYDGSSPQVDLALAQNMRCDIRTIDRVALQDEYGQRVEIHSCAEGLVMNPGPGACSALVPLRLLESRRNDGPGTVSNANGRAPIYGGAAGRGLRGKEVNALSKACVDDRGDFNDNQTEDFLETQTTPADTSTAGEEERLLAFAYFVELYTIRYEREIGAPYGRLAIAERSRCNADEFPLRYDGGGSYDPAEAATYWRSCYRNRDPGYSATEERASYDFAQWSCSESTGSCSPAPPAHPGIDASAGMNPDEDDLLRGHGLCELGSGNTPADGIWRGMNHHSQFKCVEVGTGAPADSRYRVEPSAFGSSGTHTMNSCVAVSCDPAEVDCIESQQSEVVGTSDPVVHCTASTGGTLPAPGDVGWAAVHYQPYGDIDGDGVTDDIDGDGLTSDEIYAGSCVNEDEEWRYLCPYPEFDLTSSPADAFGRYRCHGRDSSFLWATASETAENHDRASLLWANPGESAPNLSMWR